MVFYRRVGSSNFKNGRKSFKAKPFSRKRYYKRSTNSATIGKGRFVKAVEVLTLKVDSFHTGPQWGALVLSSHVPMYSGPTLVQTVVGQDSQGQPITRMGMTHRLLSSQVDFLKPYENCYLRRIKVTPILNYNSDLKLVFFKNNVPISTFNDVNN